MASYFGKVCWRKIDGDAFGWKAQAQIVLRTHSRDSPTALSGKPTIMNAGSPTLICTWTSTSLTSIPENATVWLRARLRIEDLSLANAIGEKNRLVFHRESLVLTMKSAILRESDNEKSKFLIDLQRGSFCRRFS